MINTFFFLHVLQSKVYFLWALSGLQEFKTFDFVSEDLRVDLD